MVQVVRPLCSVYFPVKGAFPNTVTFINLFLIHQISGIFQSDEALIVQVVSPL